MKAAIRRMAYRPDDASPRGALVDPSVFVVIPARNVAGHIGHTLTYLHQLGFCPEQVQVMVNSSIDDTFGAARAAGFATVHDCDQVFDSVRGALDSLLEQYGVSRTQFDRPGKGRALFAGLIALSRCPGINPTSPILFLDAEITNINAVDPVSCLLAGWREWRGQVELVKLASDGRYDRDILEFLAGVPEYRGLTAFGWPLCGQAIASWETLCSLRLTSCYAVEMAVLMQVWDRRGTSTVFGDVRVPEALRDEAKDGPHYTRMHAEIMAFVQRYTGLAHLAAEEIAARNRLGPESEQQIDVDVALPSVRHLLATCRAGRPED